MMKIFNSLTEAFAGYYEVENLAAYQEYVERESRNGQVAVLSSDSWIASHVERTIRSATPRKRMDVYLQWNGISGYTSMLWELSQGKIEH